MSLLIRSSIPDAGTCGHSPRRNRRGSLSTIQVQYPDPNVGPLGKRPFDLPHPVSLLSAVVKDRPRQPCLFAFSLVPDRDDRLATLGVEPPLLSHLVTPHVVVNRIQNQAGLHVSEPVSEAEGIVELVRPTHQRGDVGLAADHEQGGAYLPGGEIVKESLLVTRR